MRKIHLGVSDCEVLDWVKWRLSIGSDKELASLLETSPSVISKIRGQQIPLGSGALLKILELTGVRVLDLKKLVLCYRSITFDQSKNEINKPKTKYGENYAKSTNHV